MAVYFFSFQDGREALPDPEPHQFETPDAARRALITVMCQLVTDSLPDGDDHVFRSQLHAADGQLLYDVDFTLHGRWSVLPG